MLNLFTAILSLYQNQQEEPSEGPSLPSVPADVYGTTRVDRRVDQLLLVVQALWTLVQDKTGLTDRELVVRVTELDTRDGAADGRVTKPPVTCVKCGATVARKFNRCLFCGEPYREGSAFDTV